MTNRYRQSMTQAMEQVHLSEKEITKLKNGVKVLGNALPNRALAQKMADKANKEMGHDADVYHSPFNNRFYVRIKEETLNEKDHEISMARGELEAISDKALKLSSILQGKSDEGNPLEAWVQSKITKAKDYINSVADYMEYNPDNAMEAKVECPKCGGKGCEHCDNKGYHMTESFNDAQIAKLKKEYEPLRGKKISIDNANKLGAMFTKFDKDKNALEKLYGGNIPFISTMAMTRLMTKHNYKAADLNKIRKESVELADELFILEEVHMLDEAEATISRFKGDKEAENIMSLAKQQGVKATRSGNQIHLKGMFRKVMDISMALQRNGMKVEEIMNEEKLEEFTSQQIKMAYGVANDKRYKAGNYSGAVAAIEKIAKGLSKHPDVAKVLKRVNEDLEEGMMSKIDQMQKDGKSTAEIAKALGMDVKVVKGILGEENIKEEEDPKKLENELKQKENEIAQLKQKAETDKAKNVQKQTQNMTNPETGEPLLKIGIAYKALKDKMAKEKAAEARLKEKEAEQKKQTLIKFKDKIRKVTENTDEELNESDASDKAKAMGLTYMKFGRYGKDGKVTHKSIGGNLTKVDAKGEPVKDDEPKTDAPKDEPKTDAPKDEPTQKKTAVDVDKAKKELEGIVSDGIVDVETDEEGRMFVTKEYEPSQDYDAENDVEEIKKYFAKQGVKPEDMVYDVDYSDDDEEDGYIQIQVQIRGPEQKEAKDNAYAIGMAQAKKMTGDEKPLKKSTITKGHKIAKSILKKEEKEHPAKMKYEEIAGLKKKAEKSGMPYGILKKVYDRGMAAWRGGHRPGATQQQWAFARVNSFVTKSSGTWGGADKDLAAKGKGSK